MCLFRYTGESVNPELKLHWNDTGAGLGLGLGLALTLTLTLTLLQCAISLKAGQEKIQLAINQQFHFGAPLHCPLLGCSNPLVGMCG